MDTNGSDLVMLLLIHCREDKGPGIAVLPATSVVCLEQPLVVLGMSLSISPLLYKSQV